MRLYFDGMSAGGDLGQLKETVSKLRLQIGRQPHELHMRITKYPRIADLGGP